MFQHLFRKADDFSLRVLLGETVKKRAWQLQDANPLLSDNEAERLAIREAMASARSEAVDLSSISAVQDWSKNFLSRA